MLLLYHFGIIAYIFLYQSDALTAPSAIKKKPQVASEGRDDDEKELAPKHGGIASSPDTGVAPATTSVLQPAKVRIGSGPRVIWNLASRHPPSRLLASRILASWPLASRTLASRPLASRTLASSGSQVFGSRSSGRGSPGRGSSSRGSSGRGLLGWNLLCRWRGELLERLEF